jgi:hypothetical protein
MPTPLFRAIDSIQLPVRDLDAAVDMSRGPITASTRT